MKFNFENDMCMMINSGVFSLLVKCLFEYDMHDTFVLEHKTCTATQYRLHLSPSYDFMIDMEFVSKQHKHCQSIG